MSTLSALTVCYIKDVAQSSAGVIELDGKYYYVGAKGKLVTGSIYVYASHANGLLPRGEYQIADDYSLIIPGPKNGIVNGYYYVDDVATYAGLIEIDGDYYYAGSKGKLITGTVYIYSSRTNGLLPRGEYTFDENTYKMIID